MLFPLSIPKGLPTDLTRWLHPVTNGSWRAGSIDVPLVLGQDSKRFGRDFLEASADQYVLWTGPCKKFSRATVATAMMRCHHDITID